MDKMILCCGEALIDFVPLPKGEGYRPLPGGSIFNTAVAIARLGVPSALFTKLSTDFFGDMLADALAANGVEARFILRGDEPTTLAFVSLSGEETCEPVYQFYLNGSADRSLSITDLPGELPDEVCALHFGSISLVLEPGASALEALIERESGKRIISLDPNIRPSLIPDHVAYLQRFERWLEWVNILRLSDTDFEWLYPEADQNQVIGGWLSKGPCLCLLTHGGQGASAYAGHLEPVHLAASLVQVADTIGAGDSFTGACLASLFRQGRLSERRELETIQENGLRDCLADGVRAAGITCSRPGAAPPYLHEML